jgi:hypothetical protein
MNPPDLVAIASLWERLWDAGYRPIAVFTFDHPDRERAGKSPAGKDWPDRARQDPPEAVRLPAVPHLSNTGVLCDALRPVDVDVDDPELAGHIRAIAFDKLGEPPMRFRENSGRCLLPYRAAAGEPRKRILSGRLGKVEVLGKGQQFVSHGFHPSGVPLYWSEPLEQTSRDSLPAITENQITEFLNAIAPLIEAEPERKPNGQDGPHIPPGAAQTNAEILDVIAALAIIPNDGPPHWEHWNNVGMATWAACGGSIYGFNAWCAWSGKHEAYDPAACRERWNHYAISPPERTGVGKLFAMARNALPGWQQPSEARKKAQPNPQIVIRVVNPTELEFVPVPPRLWIVQDWLPVGTVTGNYGDGGVGKTLLSQLLQTSCATRIPWTGQSTLQCKSFGLYCEDTEEELHRRQSDINTAFNQAYSRLRDMCWISGVGDDWTLVNSPPMAECTPRNAGTYWCVRSSLSARASSASIPPPICLAATKTTAARSGASSACLQTASPALSTAPCY